MIQYAVQDINEVEYELNGELIEAPRQGSLRQKGDAFDWETKVIDKTYLPGSSKVGTSRLEKRTITFAWEHVRNNDTDFRKDYNELVFNLEKAVYLVDKTNNLKIKVVLKNSDTIPDIGAERRSASEEFTFTCLNPYWELCSTDQVTQSLIGGTFNDIGINNQGFLEAFPILTFDTSVAVSDILIIIPEVNQSFQLQDPLFGTGGYDNLIVDNEEGKALLSELNRNAFIVPGTGFLRLPVGSSTVRIFPSTNCDVTITWCRRFYV